jgi:hypothetical protein
VDELLVEKEESKSHWIHKPVWHCSSYDKQEVCYSPRFVKWQGADFCTNSRKDQQENNKVSSFGFAGHGIEEWKLKKCPISLVMAYAMSLGRAQSIPKGASLWMLLATMVGLAEASC